MALTPDTVFRNLEDFAGIASDWFWETDAAHRFTYFSARMEEVTKIEAKTILGKRRDKIEGARAQDANWLAHLQDLQMHRPFRNFEYALTRPVDGSVMWLRVAGQPLFDAEGQFTGYRGTGHDITNEKEAMRQLFASLDTLAERNRELDDARRALERSALEDALTGVRNRRAFERDIKQVLNRATDFVGLLHIDLDRFKWVNDTLGHPAGDAVLIAAADRIDSALGGCGTVYRVGGDEFMVLLTDGADTDLARWIGDSIVEAMSAPIIYDQHRATVGVSVGIATGGGGNTTAGQLIADADAALYEAKRGGRNAVREITPAIQQSIRAQRQLAVDLPRALERGEFVAFFQPQVLAETNEIIGAEALVRWQHPDLGLLTPDKFLSAAAELGLMATIDRIMLREALNFSERVDAAGLTLASVSVNISAARLMDPALAKDVRQWWTCGKCKLAIELLETIYFDDVQDDAMFVDNLTKLRAMGVSIEIDDFGSGHASITGLLRIHPDRLKIDRSLVQAAVTDPVKRKVVTAILEMTRALGISALAEGVETEHDVAVMQSLGCQVFQGYAYAKPMNGQRFMSFIAAAANPLAATATQARRAR